MKDRSLATCVALALILTIGVVVRVALVTGPMRYDEAATYLAYVRPVEVGTAPPMSIVRAYSANNHLLNSALIWCSVRAFGDREWAIRLPALLAGAAVVLMAYILFADLAGRHAGLLAAALAAGSTPLIFFSVNARGYSLLALWTLVCFWAAGCALRRYGWWVVLGVGMALGIWTMPVMVFSCAAVVVWVGLAIAIGDMEMSRRACFARLLAALALAAVLTIVLYLPAYWNVGGGAIFENKWVRPRGFSEFARDLWPMPLAIARSWSAGWPAIMGWMVHIAALASLIVWRRIARPRVAILFATMVGGAAVLLLTRRVPPTRVWMWVLPIYLGAAAVTLTALVMWLLHDREKLLARVVPLIAVLVAAGGSWSAWSSGAVLDCNDTGSVRDARAVAKLLQQHLRPTDRVIATVPADAPLAYYLARDGVDAAVFNTPSPRRVFVVMGGDIDRAALNGQGDESETFDELLVHRRLNAQLFAPPEQIGHFAGADVYVIVRRRGRLAAEATTVNSVASEPNANSRSTSESPSTSMPTSRPVASR